MVENSLPRPDFQVNRGRFAKRAFDVLASIAGLVVFSPVLALSAIFILATDGAPILYRQRRVGVNGRPFTILKFRTMRVGADRHGLLTERNDSRITRVGSILRKTKVDELPQLLNVLRGDMSFVGPRPEVEKYVELYTPEQRSVLHYVPGITDPASIKYRDESELLACAEKAEELYVKEIMPDKIRINLEYASRANVLTDFCVIIKTLGKVVKS